MIREAIDALVSGRSLSQEEAAGAMEEIMTGEATPAQFGAFVTALRMKGETVEEIAGLATVMRAKATKVDFPGPLLDTCGTGGDAACTYNVSTAAAFVAAGAGATVAKHGNRAMSSRCGSADVLEALGVKIDLGPEGVRKCLEQVGIGFMFAPAFHPAMKYAAGPRREIGIRTVFNILGPLTNPAGAKAQVIGVAIPDLTAKMAEVLKRLGAKHALVVHGEDGLDELSISSPSTVCELKNGEISCYSVTPEELGLKRAGRDSIMGSSAQENAEWLRGVLKGATGPGRDVVLMNATAALVAADMAADLKQGLALAARSIDSGAALKKLEKFIEVSQSLA
ncbi:MAG: anthranilate phosphoribosyltransferase [Chloroflexi bacterium]|nr:anthranilate phosphoribosyltransferase [Chloroflexota bacterium]